MKAYLLFVLFTATGETFEVSSVKHKDLLGCVVEKSTYKESEGLKFYCKRLK